MTVEQKHDLHTRVVGILGRSPEPLSVPQIENELRNGQFWEADTFDVRDAVAELVADRKAEFVPGRLVRSVR